MSLNAMIIIKLKGRIHREWMQIATGKWVEQVYVIKCIILCVNKKFRKKIIYWKDQMLYWPTLTIAVSNEIQKNKSFQKKYQVNIMKQINFFELINILYKWGMFFESKTSISTMFVWCTTFNSEVWRITVKE